MLMDKGKLHHLWRRMRAVKPLYFLIITVVFALVGVLAMRQNNINMIKLRDVVYEADKNGTDVEVPLRNLREYVYSHMNTNLASGDNTIYPPIQLKYQYERLLEAQSQSASAENAKIYTAAQQECERRFPQGLSGSGRIPCIQEYIASQGIKETVVPVALYQFDFISPRWSPDLAGWSWVAASFFGILFVLSLIVRVWMKHELRD